MSSVFACRSASTIGHPLVAQSVQACAWLGIQAGLQLAQNTVDAYGRALQDYLTFCERRQVDADSATRQHLAAYVRDLAERPNPRGTAARASGISQGLANATLQQRLTAVRLYYWVRCHAQRLCACRRLYSPCSCASGARRGGERWCAARRNRCVP